MEQENSISIINRGKDVIGERAGSLPVSLVTNFSWVKIFFAGCIITAITFIVMMSTSLNQVVAVEVSGRATDFEILKLK